MRCILGLDYPDAGRITVDGRDYHDLGYPMREVGALLDAKAGAGGDVSPTRGAFTTFRSS